MREAMTMKDFREWFARAKPGECVVYHRGDLAYDRQAKTVLQELTTKAISLGHLASHIYDLSDQFEIYLMQKRLGVLEYEYRAVRASPWMIAKNKRLTRRPLSAHQMQIAHPQPQG